MDSMCLLHAFTKIINSKLFKSVHDFIIVAQHFNHKKLGSESDEDAAFVIKQCLKLGVPIYQEIFPEVDLEKENFQNYARNWRKSKASELCTYLKDKLNCSSYFIVTAHHARDHVESVLMHILRGCSLNGLVGIQEFDDQKIFYRPFFNIEYEKIEKYCLVEKVKFRLDSSNLSSDYERNYIRNKILPHFKIINNSYQKSFHLMSTNICEYLEVLSLGKNTKKSRKIIILENMGLPEIYEQFIMFDKSLTEDSDVRALEIIDHMDEISSHKITYTKSKLYDSSNIFQKVEVMLQKNPNQKYILVY